VTEQAEIKAAVERVGDQFHATRLSHDVCVDPKDLHLVLKAAGYYPGNDTSEPPPSRDEVLEEAAQVVEGCSSWGLSPTKLAAVESFQTFAAKAIRAQKSDSEERAAQEAKAAA
jgi:hypothetical protein